MKLKRYYTSDKLVEGSTVSITGEEFHHLKNVMRSRVGEKIVVFNGEPINGIGTIQSYSKQTATVLVEEVTDSLNEPSINLTLFQAVCKGEKLSLITQKITELGANNICVFYSKFTDIKDKTTKLDKLERVSISACKQCGRSTVVKSRGVMSFEDMVKEAKKCDKVFVAYENASGNSLYNELLKNAKYKNIGLIIGAEGGFSEDEIEILEKNQFKIVTLGKRILRTETAAIVGVSTIMFACEK